MSEQQRGQSFGRHTEFCWEGLELPQRLLLGFFFGRDGFLNEKSATESLASGSGDNHTPSSLSMFIASRYARIFA